MMAPMLIYIHTIHFLCGDRHCSDVHAVELDEMGAEGAEMQAALAELTGRRTVPNVFVGGKTIGGGSETQALDREGKLRPMLVEAGCIPGDDA